VYRKLASNAKGENVALRSVVFTLWVPPRSAHAHATFTHSMWRAELVKRAKLAGLDANQRTAVLQERLAALAEAAGEFANLPEELQTSAFPLSTMLALAQSCKYLRMVHGLALAWIPRSDDARLILGEFLRAAPDVTSATLHASVRLPLSTLRLGRKGHVIRHVKQRGSVRRAASSIQVEQNAHGCCVFGGERGGMYCGPPRPLPCCFGKTQLPQDVPSRWAVNDVAPGSGNLFGVGLIGFDESGRGTSGGTSGGTGQGRASMSILWLSGGTLLIGGTESRHWARADEVEDDEESEDESEQAPEDDAAGLPLPPADWAPSLIGVNTPLDCAGLMYDPHTGTLPELPLISLGRSNCRSLCLPGCQPGCCLAQS